MASANSIVLFDGDCAFCVGSVKWIIAHDPAGRFRFTPRQSPLGQSLLAKHGFPPEGIESLVLVDSDRAHTHSTAVLKIAYRLSLPWSLAGVFLLIPRFLRDIGYRAVANRRYKLAGKAEACMIPTTEQRGRILSEMEELAPA